MKTRLKEAWYARAPRERAIVAVLAAVLVIALYAWLLHSAVPARAQLRASVTALRAQAASLDLQAVEYERLRAAPAPAASATELRTLVQARVTEAGLSRALVRIDALDARQVNVVFGALPFAEWLAWVASLQAQQVRLEASRIEALSTPGVVSVTATFTRAGP